MKKFSTLLFVILSLFYSALGYAEIKFKINGIGGDEETNVEIYLSDLDQPKNPEDDDYLSEIAKSTQAALSVFGYYQSIIDVKVSRDVNDKNSDQVISIDVVPGPQTTITESTIALSGEGKDFSEFTKLLARFTLNKGEVLLHRNYESAKANLKSIARRYGYFDATFTTSQVEVTSRSNSAAVTLLFDTGPRYQFGDFVFQSQFPAQKYVASLRNFSVGDDFDINKLGELNQDLSETGYFKSITILPDFNQRDGLLIPLNVIAFMQPEDSFNAGLGYSTDEGIRGTFGWKHPWVNEAGHSIEGDLIASLYKQEVSLTYKIPLADPLYDYLSLQSGYQMLDQNDTDTTLYVASVNRHWRFSNRWRRTIFLRYEHEEGTQGQQDLSTSLIIPGISFSRTRAKGGINTTWGEKLITSLELSNEWWLSSDDLVKLYGQAKYIRTYAGHQFVGMVELGAIQTDSIYNVPSSMRFFTGGDQSIRGFDYESIAPEDSDEYLIGGKYLAVGSFEYRFPILDNWKIALFADIGTATDDFSEELSSSIGTGVVWASPVGPIRLYLARPMTNKINSFGIHFMIGPEL